MLRTYHSYVRQTGGETHHAYDYITGGVRVTGLVRYYLAERLLTENEEGAPILDEDKALKVWVIMGVMADQHSTHVQLTASTPYQSEIEQARLRLELELAKAGWK